MAILPSAPTIAIALSQGLKVLSLDLDLLIKSKKISIRFICMWKANLDKRNSRKWYQGYK